MDQKKMVKQMIEVNLATFNNVFDSMVLIQDQFESIAMKAMDQSGVVPEEGRRAIEGWVNVLKDGRKNIKSHIDSSLQQAEKLLDI